MRALIIALLLCSVTYAGEKIDSFEGLEIKKEDGVLIIDCTSSQSAAKLKDKAERSGKKAKQQWKKIHRNQNLDKVIESIKEARKDLGNTRARPIQKTATPSKYKVKDSSEYYKEAYQKRLREIKAEERSRSYNKYERKYKERRKQRYKDKLKDIEQNPEAY